LKFTHGEWLLVLDADAELKQDSLIRLFSFVEEGDWSAVQLRKSVTNASKNFLTSCQSMEMAMDAIFQYGRLSVAGVSDLRGNGQLIKIDSLYSAQQIFSDKNIYKYLKETVITQELIEKLASGIDFSQAISQDNKVLEESILTLLRLFTIELKE